MITGFLECYNGLAFILVEYKIWLGYYSSFVPINTKQTFFTFVPQTNNVTQMKKDKILKFRVTEEEEAQLIKASKDKNINLSDEIRQRVFVATNENEQNEIVPQTKIKPINAAKPKKISKPTEDPNKTAKTPLNKPQKVKGVYSTAKRPNAKNSPDRVVLKF